MNTERKVRAVSFDWEQETGSRHHMSTKLWVISLFGDSVARSVRVNLYPYQTTGLLNFAHKEGLLSTSLSASTELFRRQEPHVALNSNTPRTFAPGIMAATHTDSHSSGPAPLHV